jgi:GNAT superfamily N-acetyltransferase
VRVLPFEKAHQEDAAALLAETVGMQGRANGPRYKASNIASARATLAEAIDSGPAVIAQDAATVVGFMIAPLPNVPGSGRSRMKVVHHAAWPSVARTAYRHMYEQVAGELVAAGCFEHSILVRMEQRSTLMAMFDLQFAIKQIKGVWALTRETETRRSEAMIRAATIDDLDRLIELSIELAQFHARTPILRPALLDVPSMRSSLAENIQAQRDVVLVASDGHHLVGMIQAQPDRLYADTATIGMNIVSERARSAGVGSTMLTELCAWATDLGFEHCAVGWDPANLVGDAFYRRKGFRPVRYELSRTIDSRVAWANEHLRYPRLRLQ